MVQVRLYIHGRPVFRFFLSESEKMLLDCFMSSLLLLEDKYWGGVGVGSSDESWCWERRKVEEHACDIGGSLGGRGVGLEVGLMN